MSISSIAALNEVLLQAAIRAERINAEPMYEKHARELARRNDRLTSNNLRPVSSPNENAEHEPDRRQQPA